MCRKTLHLALFAALACAAPHAQTIPTASLIGQSAEDIRSERGEPVEVKSYEAGPEVYAADMEVWAYETSEHETVMYAIREGVAYSEMILTSFDGLEAAIYHVTAIAAHIVENGTVHRLHLDGIEVERPQSSIVYRSFGQVGMHISDTVEIIEAADGDGYQVRHTRFDVADI